MKKLFTNRWLLSILGLLALALLIWLLGPLIGIGDRRPLVTGTARLIAILVVVALWALNQLRKALRANKANQGMVDGLVAAQSEPEPDRSAEEVATLKQRFEQAVAVLKKAKGKRGRLSLYDLPWYIIIGPPGSGKTTALVNSGLDFPLADHFGREALSGVGGTRNCDWWFTDEAILLDTAGRYTTQDSDAQVDRSAWEGFLGLLKKHRRRRPINGVLVAISLLDLMTQSEQERAAHARAVKTRIQELDQYFKIRFPVYVILTKCDLVAGFMEFFDDLGRAEREQVWGMTFPIEASESPGGAAERFGAELDQLLERLGTRLLWRMSQERDPRRRAAIYGFPRQLASLKHTLETFLADVFRGSRFEQAPMLRGVYFTSGTQEGTPIDRLMGAVARTFGLDSQALAAQGGQGRSYFIKSLLTRVVFAEAELAGTNRRAELRRAVLQKAAYAGSIVVAVLLVLGWTWSYFDNRALIADVQAATEQAHQAVDDVAGGNLDVLSVLPALEAVRTIPGAQRGEGTPLLRGLGLYQGGKLGRQAESAYRRVLTQVLLPRLILRLENQLRGGGAGPDFQYLALKTYLMLDSRDHYDANEIDAWFKVDFNNNLPRQVSTADRDALFTHLQALFEEQPLPLPLPLDQSLIERTQRVVARMPPEERIYSRLKRGGAGNDLPPFTLFDAAGPRAPLVFTRRSNAALNEGISGLFTRDGYRKVFLAQSASEAADLIDESWILGQYAPPSLDQALVLQRVKNLYLEDYVREYENLILDIQLAPFSTAEQASDVLNILSDPANSPLVRFLQSLAEQTQLESPVEQAASSAGDRAKDAVERLQGLLGGGQQKPDEQEPQAAGNLVDQRFKWVRDLVGDDPSAAPIQNVLMLLDELYRFMAVVVAERGSHGDIPASVAQQGQAVVQQLRTVARRQPEMIQGILEDAAGRSQTLAFRGVMANINTEWQSRGLPFCRQAISGRYPIVRGSEQEIRLDDFGKFFGPGGIVDSFFSQYLADYVDMSQHPWRVRAATAVPVRISADALRQFERAAAIRDTFFRAGDTPSVTFEMRPVGMDATINQFTLELAGQRISYSHGPIVTEYMEWPGPDQNGEVRVEMTPPASDGGSMIRERGPWAWFRVLDQANITPADRPEWFNVEFKLGERTALYQLIARSAYNPFGFPELEQFRCPETL